MHFVINEVSNIEKEISKLIELKDVKNLSIFSRKNTAEIDLKILENKEQIETIEIIGIGKLYNLEVVNKLKSLTRFYIQSAKIEDIEEIKNKYDSIKKSNSEIRIIFRRTSNIDNTILDLYNLKFESGLNIKINSSSDLQIVLKQFFEKEEIKDLLVENREKIRIDIIDNSYDKINQELKQLIKELDIKEKFKIITRKCEYSYEEYNCLLEKINEVEEKKKSKNIIFVLIKKIKNRIERLSFRRYKLTQLPAPKE